MRRFKTHRRRKTISKQNKLKAIAAEAPPKQAGLFVTQELATAIEACRAKVEYIAQDHRAKNKKFRDTDFDLENDRDACLHGFKEAVTLDYDKDQAKNRDVLRVSELFDHPHFFPENGAANSNSIRQGNLGSCYFLAALATVSNVPGLIEKICVARDEQVGVYGFIFYQDDGWASVIIDDLLLTDIPKWETLMGFQQALYHEDKEQYMAIARKGGNSLTFARAGAEQETWVPLIEKAYAKLYTNFAHLEGGFALHSVEDLTGGVSVVFTVKDILDIDRFWKEELAHVNKDRLFAVSFRHFAEESVQGLHGSHAYSILRAVECNGKRFVILRNPWGDGEWTGAWSDGSKEWTHEWIQFLPELDHTFGEDGQFVMEYKDFLGVFERVQRTFLFDDSWLASSSWIELPFPKGPHAWAYGHLSYMLTIPEKTKTILVLSKLNDQAYRSIKQTKAVYTSYAVVKLGESQPIQTVADVYAGFRSLSLELDLDAGTYIVYVRADRIKYHGEKIMPGPQANVGGGDDDEGSEHEDVDDGSWVNKDSKVIARILSAKVRSRSLAENWETTLKSQFTPKTLEQAIAEDLREILADAEKDDAVKDGTQAADGEACSGEGSDDDTIVGNTDGKLTKDTAATTLSVANGAPPADVPAGAATSGEETANGTSQPIEVEKAPAPSFMGHISAILSHISAVIAIAFVAVVALFRSAFISRKAAVTTPAESSPEGDATPTESSPEGNATADAVAEEETGGCEVEVGQQCEVHGRKEDWRTLLHDAGSSVVLGLRVYTQTKAPATVAGRLKLPGDEAPAKFDIPQAVLDALVLKAKAEAPAPAGDAA